MRFHIPVAIVTALVALPSIHAQHTAWTVDGPGGGDQFGHAAIRIHDWDHDGTKDVLIGAPGTDNGGFSNVGAVLVLSARTGAILAIAFGGSTLEKMGTSLLLLPDLNGDAVGEIAAGAPGFGGSSPSGAIRVFDGATLGLLGTVIGPMSGARLGERLVACGDVNGDGLADFAASARGMNNGAAIGAGAVLVYDVANGSVLRSFFGQSSFDGLGSGLDALKDVTGDGKPELLAGAPGADPAGVNGAGEVRVIDPHGNAVIKVVPGLTALEALGTTCAGLDDLDHDGKAELLLGAPSASVGPLQFCGSAFVVSFASGAVLDRFDGAGAFDHLGQTIANVGDLDRDGVADLAIGSPDTLVAANPSAGQVVVYSGIDRSLLYRFEGIAASEQFGGAAYALGDLNGDQRNDVGIGSPYRDSSAADVGRFDAKLGQVGELTMLSSGQFGSPWELRLVGKPLSPTWLMLDVAPGAWMTQYGKFQLAVSPVMLIMPFGAISPAGNLAVIGFLPATGLPPNATFYLQAIAQLPSFPFAYDVSSLATLTVHP